MKKVKIIVAAFAVVAVVGGALAFKARTHTFYYTQKDPATGHCTILTNTLNTTTDFTQHKMPIWTTTSEPCPDQRTTIAEF